MNQHSIGLLALAALTTGAAGQSLSVNLTFNQTVTSIGDTVTATVSATLEGFVAGSYLSSFNIDLIASGAFGDVSNVSAVAWNNPALGFNGQGVASGADILDIQASQFALIPPITTGNVLVFTFDFTTSAEGRLTYSARVAEGAPFAFSVTGPSFDALPRQFGVEAFHSGFTGAVPAPGGAVVLTGAGLLASRRRRGV